MKKIAFAGILAAASFAGTAHAQAASVPTSPFSVEVRAGAAVPTGDLSDINKTGYTVGANVSFAVSPMLSVYGGYTMNSFGFKDEFVDDGSGDSDASARLGVSGPEAGLKINIPTAGTIVPFVKGAALYHRYSLSVSSSDGSATVNDDQWRWGFEAGAGVAIPLGPRLSVTPAVSYTKVEHATGVKADVGLSFHL